MDGAPGAKSPSISWLTRKCGNVTSWIHLWALIVSWLMAVDSLGRHAGAWRYIQGLTWNHENEGKTNNLGYAVLGVCCTRCKLYSVYAVLGVCCPQCMQYLVYAVLGVCCTRCMLYSVYAVLSVNSWSWHEEIERDDLTLCSATIVVDEKERDGGMKMRMMWRIQANMRNQGYELPDSVGKTSYPCNYTLDRDSYLPYRGW